MTRFLIQIALLLLVVVFALKRGGKPERHVAFTLLAMLLANIIYAWVAGQWTDYDGVPVFRVLLDLAGFAIVLLVALRADRWWPLWVAAIQLQAVLAHLLRSFDADLPPLIYAVMERWPFWIAIILTGIGTYLHARRVRTAAES